MEDNGWSQGKLQRLELQRYDAAHSMLKMQNRVSTPRFAFVSHSSICESTSNVIIGHEAIHQHATYRTSPGICTGRLCHLPFVLVSIASYLVYDPCYGIEQHFEWTAESSSVEPGCVQSYSEL